MSKLTDFLVSNPVEDITAKIRVSKRIPFDFKIKALTTGEHQRFQSQCRSKIKKDGIDFDNGKFNILICIACTTEPNFSAITDIEKVGCKTPSQYVQKVLTSGEVAELAEQILKLSGFDDDMDEDIKEAKNS